MLGKATKIRFVHLSRSRLIGTASTKQKAQPSARDITRSNNHHVLEKDRIGISPPKSTLAMLPTSMLLRSLLISIISTKSFLLKPSILILGYLSRSQSPLLHPDKNLLIYWLLKKTFYEHFCAGENTKEVRATIEKVKDMGFKGVILGYAKEIVVDRTKIFEGSTGKKGRETTDRLCEYCPDIASWEKGVLATIEMIGEHDFIALKLTGAGSSSIEALKSRTPIPEQMGQALDRICNRAAERKVRILIDAEQQSEQSGIDILALDLMRKHNRDGVATVYNTYQAYLKNTGDNLAAHMKISASEGFTIGIKLVRGAYINSEPRHIIHCTKEDTDQMYDSIVEGILTQSWRDFKSTQLGGLGFPSAELFLGTHNGISTRKAARIQSARLAASLATPRLQYGQLLGMADEVSGELLQMRGQRSTDEAPQVYKCLSWGSVGECVSYLLRRAIENRDAVSRTQDAYLAVVDEIKRRAGLFFWRR